LVVGVGNAASSLTRARVGFTATASVGMPDARGAGRDTWFSSESRDDI
jgi:hypothetical protein